MKYAICHPERPLHTRTGLCAACYSKEYYQSHKREALLYKRQYERTRPEWYLWKTAKDRARKFGWKFNIVPEDVKIPSHCPVLGIPLVPFSGRFAHNSPSIDRIDNSKGYVKGNILVVSFRANSLKKDATAEELMRVATFYTTLGGV